MKRVYLHIGLHKTGSTRLQMSLAASGARLAERGVLYPQAGRPTRPGTAHHLLAWDVSDRRALLAERVVEPGLARRGAVAEAIRAELEGGPEQVAILSSEELDGCDAAAIASIRDALGDVRIVPVVFLRNYADLLESYYGYMLAHHHETASAKRFLAAHRSVFDVVALVERWSQAMGSPVIAIDYDDPAIRRDVFAAFTGAIGIGAADLPHDTAMVNAARPAPVALLARYAKTAGLPGSSVGRWAGRVSRSTGAAARHQPMRLIDAPLRARLVDAYARDVARLHEIASGRSEGEGSVRLVGRFERTGGQQAVSVPLVTLPRALAFVARHGRVRALPGYPVVKSLLGAGRASGEDA